MRPTKTHKRDKIRKQAQDSNRALTSTVMCTVKDRRARIKTNSIHLRCQCSPSYFVFTQTFQQQQQIPSSGHIRTIPMPKLNRRQL